MLWSARHVLLKLVRMPPSEAAGRVAQALRTAQERLWLYRLADPFRSVREAGAVADALLRNATTLLPGTRPAELERLKREFPGFHGRMCETASRRTGNFLGGRWQLFEFPWTSDGKIDWQRDPRTGFRWPSRFHSTVPLYRLPPGVDVKYVWELNRHAFLVELSRGWMLSGDARCAEASRQILREWIDANPVLVGVNWTSSLEVAVRSIAWLWTLAALAEWTGWTRMDLDAIARALSDHAEYLHRHLSVYSSPYNHLIGEATALHLLGHVLAPASGASRWRRRATEILGKHAPAQFYHDGFSREQATGYHHYTVGFLLMAEVASRHFADAPGSLQPTLKQSLVAGLAFRRPDGTWPPIGDLDSARSIPVVPDAHWNFGSIYGLGEVVLGEPLLPDRVESEEAYWLCGIEGVAAGERPRDGRGVPSGHLPHSGYASARDDASGDWLLLDAGPLADGVSRRGVPRVMHGHADHLQLLLMVNAADVLVDPGIRSYADPTAWESRLAESHTTITVEGVLVARQVARLAWAFERGRTELHVRLSPRVWLMRGVLRLDGDVTIQRNVLGLPGLGYWVVDRVCSPKPRRVSWHWQLAPGLSPVSSEVDENGLRASLPGLLWVTRSSRRLSVATDGPGAIGSWSERAAGYGDARRGRQWAFATDPTTEATLLTFIGRVPVRCTVSIEGTELSCGDTGPPGFASLASQCGLSWQVDDGRTLRRFVADPGESFDCTAYAPIAGQGDWHVLGREEVAPIASP